MSYDHGLEELWKRLEAGYVARTPKSKELLERARRVLPGGATYHIRYLKPYPPFIKRAEATRVWDVDGNAYDDYWMGHGAHVLGHAPRFVVERVFGEVRKGTHLGYEHELAVEYAELLASVVPNLEMVRFTNSGTEAVMYAARLVRAYTGRNYIVKVEGGWHGGYDALHVGVTPPFTGPESKGLPEDFIRYTVLVPYNDVDALEEALKGYEVAAVFVEPVLGAGGCIAPEPGYLKEVRRLADEHGALLVFDEVITGFRLALGGGQEFFGVDADIVVLGKAVAGGFPGAGAFGGRAEYMELLDHLKIPDRRERSFHGGTFAGNVVSVAAGYALVSYLRDNRGVYDEANSEWERFRRGLDGVCEEHGRPCWVTGAGSMVGVHFTTKRPTNVRQAYELRWSKRVEEVANLYMRLRGILYISDHMMHLLPSLIHTREQRERFLEEFDSLLSMIERELGGRPWERL